MKLLIIYTGGAGAHILKTFLDLQNMDITRSLSIEDDQSWERNIKVMYIDAATDTIDELAKKFRGKGREKYLYITSGVIKKKPRLNEILTNKYGMDVGSKGFTSHPHYPMYMFEIFEGDEDIKKLCESVYESELGENPILVNLNKIIEDEDPPDCILFVVGLGGGAGTGIINPLSRYIHSKGLTMPLFVLAILPFGRRSQASEQLVNFSAVLGLYKLLTEKQVDAVFLVDNKSLIEYSLDKKDRNLDELGNYLKGHEDEINPILVESFFPMLEQRGEYLEAKSLVEAFKKGWEKEPQVPLFIPWYYREKNFDDTENFLKNLINSGKRLADCNPEKADRVVVFIRGLELLKDLEREEDFKKKVSKCVFGNENNKDKVDIFGRFSNSGEDALMLLRNPYGVNDEKGSIKSRLIKMISSAINYIENPNNENYILDPKYFKDKIDGIEYDSRTYIKNRLKKQKDGKGLVNLLEKAKNNLESGIKPFCKEEFEFCKEFFQSKKEQAEEFGKDSGTSDGDINIIDLKNEIKDLQKEVKEIKTSVGRGSNKNDR